MKILQKIRKWAFDSLIIMAFVAFIWSLSLDIQRKQIVLKTVKELCNRGR